MEIHYSTSAGVISRKSREESVDNYEVAMAAEATVADHVERSSDNASRY